MAQCGLNMLLKLSASKSPTLRRDITLLDSDYCPQQKVHKI